MIDNSHVMIEIQVANRFTYMNGRVYDNGQSPDIFQTNLLYIINGEVIEFAKDNECLDNFQPLS